MSPPKTSWRKRRKFILGKVVRYSFTFSYILHSDTTSKMQILLSKRFFDACRCVNKSQIIVSFVCTSQSKSPPPPTREKAGTWTKELDKMSPGKMFSFQCPRFSPPPSENIFWGSNFHLVKMFQAGLVFIFLLTHMNDHNLKQREI